MDPIKNFAKADIVTKFSSVALAFVVKSGYGDRFPTLAEGSFDVTVWNKEFSDPSDDPYREIMTVQRATDDDNFTVTARGQQGTTASPKNLPGKSYAVAQTVTTKLLESLDSQTLVSVKTYGAVGDGVTDDTAAFVAALAAETYLLVPEGTYKITDNLTMQSGGTLYGKGTLNFTSGGLNLVNGCRVFDIAIQGNAYGNASSGLRLGTSHSDIIIRGVEVSYTGNNGITATTCTRVKVLDCIFHHIGNPATINVHTQGQGIRALTGCQHWQIIGCEFYQIPGDGCIFLYDAVLDTLIEGNSFHDTAYHAVSCQNHCDRTNVIGNKLVNIGTINLSDGVGASAIYMNDSTASSTASNLISGNSMYRCVENGIEVDAGLVIGNIINTTGYLSLGTPSIEGIWASGLVSVIGNTIENAGGYGIKHYSTATSTDVMSRRIFGNTIINPKTGGIDIQGDTASCNLKNIFVSHNLVIDNTAVPTVGVRIRLTNSATMTASSVVLCYNNVQGATLTTNGGGGATEYMNFYSATTTNLSLGTRRLTEVSDPSSAQDAATKAYVDMVAQGLNQKPSARLATAAALPTNTYANGSSGVGATLTGTSVGALTVDSVSATAGDNILVKDEAAPARNGLYVVTNAGSGGAAYILTRHTSMDLATEIKGGFIPVDQGTVNSGSLWLVDGVGPWTIGTTAISFIELNKAADISVTLPLVKTGNVLSVNDATATTKGVVPTPPNNTTTFLRGDASFSQIVESSLTLSDNSTADVSTTKHGFVPKAPNDTSKFLMGDGSWAQITEAKLTLADNTTADVSTTKHGLVPKAPNDYKQNLNGDGAWGINSLYPVRAKKGWAIYREMHNANSQPDFALNASGLGANSAGAPSATNQMGILTLSTGAGVGAAEWRSSGTQIVFGAGAIYYGINLGIPTLSDATNTFTVRMGFRDANNTDAVDGAYFRYTHGTNSGKWECVTRANSVETATDSGVTADTSFHDYEIQINAAGTSVDFLIDGVVKATITTNIPTGTARVTGIDAGSINGTVIVSARTILIDYVWAYGEFTTPR